jgi:hypothetical protein
MRRLLLNGKSINSEDMSQIYNKIIERLSRSIEKPSLYKFFDFSIEELQDDPTCLTKISEYLRLHEGKYEDFEIHTWVDSETFKPVFMVQVYLNSEYRDKLDFSRIEKTINFFEKF